ncbi:Major facilitator transporter [Pseudomonas amygdali pv. eriobotryae]|uniref:Major facilitator transporter n=1 Tax=Pseudomonas amygdali pv. eriobotryae TaxID=129137 RepID=A0A0N8RFE7_PSEA0|nr:Major facilitator transporter [Pseudomonas amygdali pv. eriobotryae]
MQRQTVSGQLWKDLHQLAMLQLLPDQPGRQLRNAPRRSHRSHLGFAVADNQPRFDSASLTLLLVVNKQPRAGAAIATTKQNTCVTGKVLERRRYAVALQISRCSTKDHPLGAQVTVRHARWPDSRTADAHGQVDTFLKNVNETISEGYPRAQLVMLPGEGEDQRQRVQTTKGRRQIDTQLSGGLCTLRRQRGFGSLQVGKHARAYRMIGRTLLGQRQTSGSALEQTHAQAAFQACNAFADCGISQTQAVSGCRKAPSIGNGDKRFDALEAVSGQHMEDQLVNLSPQCTEYLPKIGIIFCNKLANLFFMGSYHAVSGNCRLRHQERKLDRCWLVHRDPGAGWLRNRYHRISHHRTAAFTGPRSGNFHFYCRFAGHAIRLHGDAVWPAADSHAFAPGPQAYVHRHPADFRGLQRSGCGVEQHLGTGTGAIHSSIGVAGVLGHRQ